MIRNSTKKYETPVISEMTYRSEGVLCSSEIGGMTINDWQAIPESDKNTIWF